MFVVKHTSVVLYGFFLLLLLSLEWPARSSHPHLSLILLHESFNWKLGWDSWDSLATMQLKWPFLSKGRLGREELVASLPTAFLQLLNSKDIYVPADLYTCGQRFHGAHGAFHAEPQERPPCRFPRLDMNSSFRELWAGPALHWRPQWGRNTAGSTARAFSLGCVLRSWDLTHVKPVERKEWKTHEVMYLGLLCELGGPIPTRLLLSGRKEPMRLFDKMWLSHMLLCVTSYRLKLPSSC